MTDKPLEQILHDFKNHLIVENIFNKPKEYLKEVFGDAVEFDNRARVFCRSADITDFVVFPPGEYHFADGVEIGLWNPLTFLAGGSILRFGDASRFKIFSGRFFANGTERNPVYFLPTAPGNTCEIEVHTSMAQRFSLGLLKKASTGKLPAYAVLNHCVFQGLKNRSTDAALNLNEGLVVLNDCEISGCSGYQGAGLKTRNTTLYVKGGKISDNSATNSGAAFFGIESSALFEDVGIENNTSKDLLGGAVAVHGNKSSWPKEAFEDLKEDIPGIPDHYHFKNCRIRHNTGKGGGAFYVMKGRVEFEDDCVLEGNSKPQIYLSIAESTEAKYNPEIIKDGNDD